MSMSVFNFNGTPVRTVTIDGEPWWVAKDVCDVLCLSHGGTSLDRLDPDEKGTHTMGTLGGPQSVAVINESGLYSLILRSRRPEAKAFKKWVTAEVLPTIRKTGSYSTPQAATPADPTAHLLAIMVQNLTVLTSKAGQVDAQLAAIESAQAKTDQKTTDQAAALQRIAAEVAERDLVKRQLYRSEVEHVKSQIFGAMKGRGVTAAKVAHDFWGAVKVRAGVSSVKVESLTVSMAKRLLQESVRQAGIWAVPIVVNLPIEFEETA